MTGACQGFPLPLVAVLHLMLNNVIQQMGLHALHQAAWLPTSGRVGWGELGRELTPWDKGAFLSETMCPSLGSLFPPPARVSGM